ncbi:MAG: nucleoside 2-deoxyribosyltransferase [Planctomycetaceae bacterium]|jgi:nucleoside 2-deoxyribosyltransferase|nr:nucleoside 2-deoxyribosyltransferase [Planctomycetaceae bacterium]
MFDRALENLSFLFPSPYTKIYLYRIPEQHHNNVIPPPEVLEKIANDNKIRLLLFANNPEETAQTLLLLENQGWIDQDLNNKAFWIIPKGWEHLRELKKQPAGNINQAFVAMWFNSDRTKFYDTIEEVCKETGYKALRIDRKEHNDKIDDQILAEIRKSRILIADYTGNRGGVYFEAGFALGFGLPVIHLYGKQEFDKNGPHFDTRQYNHIVYENENDLSEKLKNRIEATVPLKNK